MPRDVLGGALAFLGVGLILSQAVAEWYLPRPSPLALAVGFLLFVAGFLLTSERA